MRTERLIVAKVEQLMALCDRLEAELTSAQSHSRHLLESILHQTLSSDPASASAGNAG